MNSSARTVLRVKVWLKALLVLNKRKQKIVEYFRMRRKKMMITDILLRRNRRDFREREFKQHLLLIVNDIHSSPIDGDNHIVLRQVRTYR